MRKRLGPGKVIVNPGTASVDDDLTLVSLPEVGPDLTTVDFFCLDRVPLWAPPVWTADFFVFAADLVEIVETGTVPPEDDEEDDLQR